MMEFEHGLARLREMFVAEFYVRESGLPVNTTPDAAFGHFVVSGLAQDVSPTPLFDSSYYRRIVSENADVHPVADTPLVLHWLRVGMEARITPTPLFDEEFYLETYPDIAAAQLFSFKHFLFDGMREGRRPNRWFDPAFYTAHAVGNTLRRANEPAYLSFLLSGAPATQACRILWLLAGGREVGPEGNQPQDHTVLRAGVDAYTALVAGTKRWFKAFSVAQVETVALLFAPDEVTVPHPSGIGPEAVVANPVVAKLAWFYSEGLEANIVPGPLFDPNHYASAALARGLALENKVKLLHFLEFGISARVVPTPIFNEEYYLWRNPDLGPGVGWAFLHFIRHGLYEGRPYNSRTVVDVAPEFGLSRVAAAKRSLMLFRSNSDSNPAWLDTLPPRDRAILMAQRKFETFRASEALARAIVYAQTQEPLVGDLDQHRTILVPPLHDPLSAAVLELRSCLSRNHYEHIICVPWLRSGGADLVAGFLAHALRTLYPKAPILVLLTDYTNFERGDWLPSDVDVSNISKVTSVLTESQAEVLFMTLMRGLAPRAIYNVNSRLCWRFFSRFGNRLGPDVGRYAYLFCWDQTKTGRRVGYPSDFFPDNHANLTRVFTDTQYLKGELVRMYAIPDDVADRIVPLSTPALSTITAPTKTMAEHGVASAHTRSRPLFLWGGRLDFQKRFDVLVGIAERMPHVDFRCWGLAMLDPPPNLSALPTNISMNGLFQHLTDLPLAESDGWIFTSAWEGLPTTIIELATLGVPLVASAVGGVPELIDAETGWLIDPCDDVDGFVTAVAEMIVDPKERVARAQRLQKRVLSRHSRNNYQNALATALGVEAA